MFACVVTWSFVTRIEFILLSLKALSSTLQAFTLESIAMGPRKIAERARGHVQYAQGPELSS